MGIVLIIMLSIIFFFVFMEVRVHRVKERENQARENPVTSEQPKQAKEWYDALTAVDERPDLESLVKTASERKVPEGLIPFSVIFSEAEYQVMMQQLYKERYSTLKQDGYVANFSMDVLPEAVQVKRIGAYVLELRAALAIIEEKEQAFGLSLEGTAKKRVLEKELMMAEEEIPKYVYLKFIGMQGEFATRDLVFRKFVAMGEDKIFEMVESNLQRINPQLKSKKSSSAVATSPALAELNQFLNENHLPKDVYEELQQTINQIEGKLREQKKENEDASIRNEANILKETAKQYHQIK